MNIAQIQKMMKQAQQMQGSVEKIQKEIDVKEFSASTGGGVVEVVLLGSKKVKSINIKEEIMDVEEKEMLQDLIKSAMNQATDEIDKYTNEKMGPITKGMPF